MQDFIIEERKIIVFVLAVLILGLGLSWVKKNNSQAAERIMAISQDNRISPLVASTQDSHPELIALNQANAQELCRIPGIGPVIANRIIEYRRKNGLFKTKDELMEVKGIGPKKLIVIENHVKL
ncbi:MAG: helix-hairpin-helix domain-containing protein [Candidatus Omnitrophota bacterium]